MKPQHSILFTFLFVAVSLVGKSQSVSVDLSIKWERDYDVLSQDSIFIPKLTVTYTNNTNDSLYALKVSQGINGLPSFMKSRLIQFPPSYYQNPNWRRDRALSHLDYSNDKYYANISSGQLYMGGWDVFSEPYYIHEERESERVNDDLSDIYDYLQRHYYASNPNVSEYGRGKVFFDWFCLVPDCLLCLTKDRFVFLGPNESVEDSFNLIGFKMLRGSYTFFLEQDSFFDTVSVGQGYDVDLNKWGDWEEYVSLPSEVNGYKLYSGPFKSNKVSISF